MGEGVGVRWGGEGGAGRGRRRESLRGPRGPRALAAPQVSAPVATARPGRTQETGGGGEPGGAGVVDAQNSAYSAKEGTNRPKERANEFRDYTGEVLSCGYRRGGGVLRRLSFG